MKLEIILKPILFVVDFSTAAFTFLLRIIFQIAMVVGTLIVTFLRCLNIK